MEQQPTLDGRNMVMVLGPTKNAGVKRDAEGEERSGAKKRFKVSGAGKLKRRHAMKSHNLTKKSSKRKRAFGKDHPVAKVDVKAVKKLLGVK